jgi:aspartate 1-decarboxylase
VHRLPKNSDAEYQMTRTLLNSKLHGATVTACDLNYVGSLTVDLDLLDAADMLVYEQVHVLDLDNGARFVTYTLEGARGSGEVKVNGAAARLVHRDDRILILSYVLLVDTQAREHTPRIVQVDSSNRVLQPAGKQPA